MMFLVMQAGLAAILIALVLFSAGDRRNMMLNLVTLVVPLGWGYVIYDAFRRDEAARRAGSWNVGWAAAERKRSLGMMGAVLVAWVVLAIAVFLLY